jgi:hypothetical protein
MRSAIAACSAYPRSPSSRWIAGSICSGVIAGANRSTTLPRRSKKNLVGKVNGQEILVRSCRLVATGDYPLEEPRAEARSDQMVPVLVPVP